MFDVEESGKRIFSPIESFVDTANWTESIFARSINVMFMVAGFALVLSNTKSGSSAIEGCKNRIKMFFL